MMSRKGNARFFEERKKKKSLFSFDSFKKYEMIFGRGEEDREVEQVKGGRNRSDSDLHQPFKKIPQVRMIP